MITLNDSNLFVGQIKQVLHDFNLPNCTVGLKNPAEGKNFIYAGYIYRWEKDPTTGKLIKKQITPYKYNKKYLNVTNNLPIRNMKYDRETHRYLGKYLRFLRDFNGVNLMSMYNCFDGELFAGDIFAQREMLDAEVIDSAGIRFKTDYQGFYIYSVPVDFQKLTIRINSGSMSYMCLYVDGIDMARSSEAKRLNQTLINTSLNKFYANEVINFDPAVVINKKLKGAPKTLNKLLEFIGKNVNNLRLLLRVAKQPGLNITVLEGQYYLNNTLPNKYFVMQPLQEAWAPMLMPRYIDYPEPVDGVENDSDGYPIDIDTIYGTYTSEYNDERFALVENHLHDQPTYEILFISYLVDPTSNDIYKNPFNLVESGFNIIPQLLATNDTSTQQNLLGDRLIEYLSGNAICPLSPSYEIERLQRTYERNGLKKFGLNTDRSKYVYGIWSLLDLYSTRKVIADNHNSFINLYDVLGYVDSDVERLIGGLLDGVTEI